MKRHENWLVWLLLAGIAVPFLNGFANDFVNWDDPGAIVSNPSIRDLSPSGIASLFSEPIFFAYLPFYFLTLAFDHAFFGLEPFGFHLGNLLWHLLSGVLVFLLVRRALGSSAIAATAALLYGVHPVQVECVTWMAGRKDPLSTSFLLLSLYAFELALCAPTQNRGRFRRGLALGFAGVAFLSKATGLIFPGLFLLWQVCVRRDRPFKKEWGFHAAAFGLALVGLMIHFSFASSSGVAVERESGLFTNLGVALEVFWRQTSTLVWPFSLSPYYGSPQPDEFSSVLSLAGTVVLIGVGLAGLWSVRRKHGGLALGLGIFLLGFLPYNTIFPATEVLRADRYLSICALGFGLTVAVFAGWFRSPRVSVAVAVLCWVGFGGITFARNSVWSDSETLWADAVRKQGDVAFPSIKLGEAWLDRGLSAGTVSDGFESFGKAKESLEDALSRFPRPVHEVQALSRLGQVCLLRGEFDEASRHLRRTLDRLDEEPGALANKGKGEVQRLRSDLLLNLAEASQGQGDLTSAILTLREAVELDPENANAQYNLGNLLCRRGIARDRSSSDGSEDSGPDRDLTEGKRFLESAAELDPGAVRALLVLGEIAFFERRRVEAVRWFEKAKRRDPSSIEAPLQLAKVFLQGGDREAALAEVNRAVEIEGEGIRARTVRAQLLASTGDLSGARREFEALLVLRPEDKTITRELARLEVLVAQSRLEVVQRGQTGSEEQRGELLDQASSAAARALELDSERVDAELIRAEVLRIRRQWDRAEEQYSRALQKAPEDPLVREKVGAFSKELGYHYLLKRDRDRAIELFRRALELRPGADDHGAITSLVEQYDRELREGEQ